MYALRLSFDYLVLCLDSLRPASEPQVSPGMSPRSSAVSTSDDHKPTVFNGGETFCRPLKLSMVEKLVIFLSRETTCLSLYATACTRCCKTSLSGNNLAKYTCMYI